MQKRIVQRTSYKENLEKKKEELEKLKKRREKYELKNIGGYKQAFPSLNKEKQELYEEYLKASVCTVPFPVSKITKKKGKTDAPRSKKNSAISKFKKNSTTENQDKFMKIKDTVKDKQTKSPYGVEMRRMVTPMSQKRKKSSYKSNPKQL